MVMNEYSKIGAIQKEDPPCPYSKPCDKWHFETIDVGLICPCMCHFSKENTNKMKEQFPNITNIDKVWPTK